MPPELVAYLAWAGLMAVLTVAGVRWPGVCGSLSWDERSGRDVAPTASRATPCEEDLT